MSGKISKRAVRQAEINLDGVRLPAVNRLARSKTFKDTAKVLTATRYGVFAWEALGHALACYEAAVTYTKDRTQFGKPLASYQLIQNRLTRMLAEIAGMQFLCHRLSVLAAEGKLTPGMASLGEDEQRPQGPGHRGRGPRDPGRQWDPARLPRRPPPGGHGGGLHLRGDRHHTVANRRPGDHRGTGLRLTDDPVDPRALDPRP